jgi:hypothetical protein
MVLRQYPVEPFAGFVGCHMVFQRASSGHGRQPDLRWSLEV